MGQPYMDQLRFRWQEDDALLGAWIEAEGADLSSPVSWMDINIRLRVEISNTGDKNLTDGYGLYYNRNSGGWTAVTTTSSYVRSVSSPYFADGDTTDRRLTGTGNYLGGVMDESSGVIASYVHTYGYDNEFDFVFQFRSADIQAGDVIELQVRFDDNTALDNYTDYPTTTFPSSQIEQGAWRFYSDATPDTSMVALANENVAPTLTAAQMENGVIRLRVQISESGGAGDTDTVEVQWSPDGTNWTDIGAQATPNGAHWVFWGNGAATDGNTITSQFLTGTDASGKYHETADASETVAASTDQEIDCALRIQWPPPSVTIYLRITWGGTALGLKSGAVAITFNTPGPSVRSYSIDKTDDVTAEPENYRCSCNPRIFWDGSYWWAFWEDNVTRNRLHYYYWSGSGAWSSLAYTTFTNTIYTGRDATYLKVISGTPVVMTYWNSATSRYRRGTISGTTLNWGSEGSPGSGSGNARGSVGIDDGNYWWLAWIDAGTGIGARRSTNADAGSSWTSGWQSGDTAADSGVLGPDPIRIIGLGSDKALIVWYSGTAIKWALVTDSGGIGTVNTLVATANQFDWGVERAGSYVYLVHTDSTGANGNWVLRVFSISGESWTTGTSPSVSGQGTGGDGITVTASGTDDIYVWGTFQYDGYGNRCLQGKKYAGPGDSGTWDSSLTDLTPDEARGNGDNMAAGPAVANAQCLVLWTFNDPNLGTYNCTFEYHVLDVGGTVNLSAILAGASTTPTDSVLAVKRAMSATLTGGSLTPTDSVLAVKRAFDAILTGGSTTPDDVALAIIKAFEAVLTGSSTTPDDVVLSVVRAFQATLTGSSTTPADAILGLRLPMQATITGGSTTPDDAVLAVARAFSAVLAGSSTTPDDAVLAIVKAFEAILTGGSATPDDAILAVNRAMGAVLTGGSSTPDDAVLAVNRAMGAVITGGSLTPDDVVLSISALVQFAAILTGTSTTPDDVVLGLIKQFAAVLFGQSSSPDDAVLAVSRAFSATLTGGSATPDDAVLAVTRALQAVLTGGSATPDDVELLIAGFISFSAVLTGTSTTPDDAVLAVKRAMAAALTGTSTTPDDAVLGLRLPMQATLTGGSATPDDVALAIVKQFAATLAGSSLTPDDVALGLIKAFAAVLSGTSTTPDDAVLSVRRAMQAVLTGASTTPDDAVLAVRRAFQAVMSGQSVTPDDVVLQTVLYIAGYLLMALSGRAPGVSTSGRKPGIDFEGEDSYG